MRTKLLGKFIILAAERLRFELPQFVPKIFFHELSNIDHSVLSRITEIRAKQCGRSH
jgi:hypothetical protein